MNDFSRRRWLNIIEVLPQDLNAARTVRIVPQNYERQIYRILALFAILVDVENKMRRNSTIRSDIKIQNTLAL